MIDFTYNLVTNLDLMFIPICEVVKQIFQDIKPSQFEKIPKLYELIICNILWVIEPSKDEKD